MHCQCLKVLERFKRDIVFRPRDPPIYGQMSHVVFPARARISNWPKILEANALDTTVLLEHLDENPLRCDVAQIKMPQARHLSKVNGPTNTSE